MQRSNNIKKREKDYQARRALRMAQIRPTPDYIIERYLMCRHWRLFSKEFMFKHLKDIPQKEILDFGCGEGEISTQLARLGGYVTALDISPELIEVAKRRAYLDKVQDRIQFIVHDITGSPLPENKFDYIVCHDVLHHSDIYKTIPLLYTCLKQGGLAIMVEPIALSPLLQKIRDLIPIEKDTSPDERQLNKKDIDFIIGEFDNCQITFFNLLGRFKRYLFANSRKIDRGYPIRKTTLILLLSFDRLLLTIFPFSRKFYGTTVIVGQKTFSKRFQG